LNTKSIAPDGQAEVTVHVKNTGKVASDEVVQLYVQHLGSSVERPQLELKGFRRVHVDPGSVKDVRLSVKARDLAYWDAMRHTWKVEKEPIRLLAGGSSDNLPVSAEVQIEAAQEYKP
jgi:beta-glucosidase